MAGDESLKPEQALGVTRRQFLGTAVASGAALLVGKSDVIFGADSTTASKMASNPTFALGGDLTVNRLGFGAMRITGEGIWGWPPDRRSEEHTSELQSRENLVCRLLLEKKKSE